MFKGIKSLHTVGVSAYSIQIQDLLKETKSYGYDWTIKVRLSNKKGYHQIAEARLFQHITFFSIPPQCCKIEIQIY